LLSGLTAGEVAPELNISPRTFERLLYGEREARDWEIGRLAELTHVPESFIREAFSAGDQAGSEESVLSRPEAVATDLEEAARAIVQALPAEQSVPSSSRSAQDG
jgi:hypothetical protein